MNTNNKEQEVITKEELIKLVKPLDFSVPISKETVEKLKDLVAKINYIDPKEGINGETLYASLGQLASDLASVTMEIGIDKQKGKQIDINAYRYMLNRMVCVNHLIEDILSNYALDMPVTKVQKDPEPTAWEVLNKPRTPNPNIKRDNNLDHVN